MHRICPKSDFHGGCSNIFMILALIESRLQALTTLSSNIFQRKVRSVGTKPRSSA